MTEAPPHAALSVRTSLRDLAAEHDRDTDNAMDNSKATTATRGASNSDQPATSTEVGSEHEHESPEQPQTGTVVPDKCEPSTSTALDGGLEAFRLHVREQLTMGEDISQEEMRTRGEELDGGFFESYLNAYEVHEQNQLDMRRKVDEEAEQDVANQRNSTEPDETVPDVGNLEPSEAEELYRSLLRTVHYWLGATDANRKGITTEMHTYMKKVFGVGDAEHDTWMDDELKTSEPPQRLLRVSILEGKDLPPKDPNGLSDPFCVIGLVELDPRVLTGKKKTKHLKDLVKDETLLRTTQVVRESLNPVWNEEFELPIGNTATQTLQIDIWDNDEEADTVGHALKSHVKGFSGFGRYLRQVAETTFFGAQDDFMGRIYIPLGDLPSEGIDHSFHIMSKRQQERRKGEVHIKVQLIAEQKEQRRSVSAEDAFTEFMKLQKFFVAVEAQEFIKRGGASWHGQLTSPAVQLLHQHAMQNGMTELDEAVCDWIVVAEYHEKCGVDYKYVLFTVERLQRQWSEVRTKGVDPEKQIGQGKVQLLLNALRGFRDWSFGVLAKFRVVFPPDNKPARARMAFLLKCLEQFYEFDLIQQKLPGQNFEMFVSSAVKQSTSEWFAQRQALHEPQVTTTDTLVTAVVELMSDILTDLYQAVKVYNLMLKPMGVNYLALVFKHIDSLLSPVVQTRMKDANQKFVDLDIESDEFKLLSIASFQLYLGIKELYRFKNELSEASVSNIQMFSDIHSWFNPLVDRWIDLAGVKATRRIDRAVELDEVKGISDSAKYSTSAVDTSQCLLNIWDFWKKLEWPRSAAYEFVVRLTEVTCKGAGHYADRMHNILEKTGYYDAEGQFDVTEQLCVTLNNIDYVRKTLSSIPQRLDWDQVVSDVTSKEDGADTAEDKRARLWTLVTSADEGMGNKRKQIISKIGEKMGVDILRYVSPLLSDPESTSPKTSITGLMKYLSTNLQFLSNNLMVDVFRLILYNIYCICINKAREAVDARPNVTPSVSDRLLKGLEMILPFFAADGHGLQQEEMETTQYKQLMAMLKMRKMDTRDLVCKYFSELAAQQAEKKQYDRGTLTVQVGYLAPRGQLCVKVLNGRNLPALDPTGSSDPYVTVQPFPRHLFEDKSGAVHKTKTQKGTLTPIFDETFLIRSRPSTLEVEGTAVLFVCYDWDMITKDDLIGECIYLLSRTKAVDTEKEVDGLKQVMLPLSLPDEPEDRHSAYYVLQSRTWDKAAMEFIKMRKKLFKKADSERK